METTDRLQMTHDRLIQAVESLTTGEDWRNMLDVAHRFNHYSANNLLLITSQRPDATRVAGFRTWKSFGRYVKKGEHGIAILAPVVGRTKSNEERGSGIEEQPASTGEQPESTRVVRGFQVVHVFDVAQTDGAPIPDVVPAVLDGDAPSQLWELLATRLSVGGFNLLRGDCRPANATTHFLTRTVVVRPDLAPAQAVKSLAHEVAHTLLHEGAEYGKNCRGIAEVEAESVAFLVCAAAGLATGTYTFPYVARWAEGDVDLVRSTSERVIGCARALTAAMGIGGADHEPSDEAP